MLFLTILAFIIILGLLIFVHELGHFLVAKASKIKVEEFAFGFPPRLFGFQMKKTRNLKEVITREEIKIEIEDVKLGQSEKITETVTDQTDTQQKTRSKWNFKFAWGSKQVNKLLDSGLKGDSTTYAINLIPFGGYVKMLGEETNSDSPRSFSSKKARIRLAVVVAGVVMNFILAGVLFSIGYMVGMSPISLDPSTLGGNQTNQVLVADVLPNSPAQAAGIKPNDIINGFAGIDKFSTFTKDNSGKVVSLTILREGQTINLNVALGNSDAPLGVSIADLSSVKLSFFKAIYYGFKDMIFTTWLFIQLLWGFIAGLFTHKTTAGEVAGPVGIFNLTGQAVRMGFSYILKLAAMLSINLGLINIIPFPALDGGRAAIIFSEGVFRRKVIKSEVENILHYVGFIVLILLMIAVTAKEVIGLF